MCFSGRNTFNCNRESLIFISGLDSSALSCYVFEIVFVLYYLCGALVQYLVESPTVEMYIVGELVNVCLPSTKVLVIASLMKLYSIQVCCPTT